MASAGAPWEPGPPGERALLALAYTVTWGLPGPGTSICQSWRWTPSGSRVRRAGALPCGPLRITRPGASNQTFTSCRERV